MGHNCAILATRERNLRSLPKEIPIIKLLKSPKLYFVLALVVVFAGLYYSLAQVAKLPGATALRERWGGEGNWRSRRGKRSHTSTAGPVDLGKLAIVAIAFGMCGAKLRKKQSANS